jgi:hypothetical protein
MVVGVVLLERRGGVGALRRGVCRRSARRAEIVIRPPLMQQKFACGAILASPSVDRER